ncbi:putative outer membrane protein [Acinetobacter baumannii]|nr:putative outer membrane protein [Acinetobacter baumannii]
MKAILTKKIISCITISGVLSLSAFEIMAANQQTINGFVA